MTRVYVCDPDARPSRDWHAEPWPVKDPIKKMDAGLRIMEAEAAGWVSGRIVKMAIYGNTAMMPIKPKPGVVIERWQIFMDEALGAWVAWVIRPRDDDRDRRRRKEHRIELLVAGVLILVAAILAALILVVLPQCTGGNFGGL